VDWGRVRREQELLETTSLSIEQVASTVGFRSASVLRDHFGGIVGTTPLANAFAAPGRGIRNRKAKTRKGARGVLTKNDM
jgi:AraC-like DNA-binding protein